MKKYILATLALTLSTCSFSPAYAQQNCAAREAMVNKLTTQWSEQAYAIGLSGRNSLVELYINRQTGSWTLLRTSALGISCIADSGTAMEVIPYKRDEKDS